MTGEEEETAWQGILSFLCSPLCSGFKRCAERWNTEFLQQVVLVFFFSFPPFLLAALAEKGWEENRYDSRAISFVPSFGMCRVYIQIVTQSLNTLPLRVSRQPQVNTRNRVVVQTRRHTHTQKHTDIQVSHTHTHNLKCPICFPNTSKKVSPATKNKKCLVRVFCSDKQKLENQ